MLETCCPTVPELDFVGMFNTSSLPGTDCDAPYAALLFMRSESADLKISLILDPLFDASCMPLSFSLGPMYWQGACSTSCASNRVMFFLHPLCFYNRTGKLEQEPLNSEQTRVRKFQRKHGFEPKL